MITIPPNFNPTIPPRGTKAFLDYIADTCIAASNGLTLVTKHINGKTWRVCPLVDYVGSWHTDDYAILPQPKITYRWYTRDEFMRLVPTHGRILIRVPGNIATAFIAVSGDAYWISTTVGPDCMKHNFHCYEKSLDGGITWEPVGVRVES